MKVRQGFVSNSSSSSFIIALNAKPSSTEELQKLLFGDASIFEYYDYSMTTSEAAQMVFESLINPVGEKEIIEELGYGTPYGDTHLSEPQYPYSSGKYDSPEYKKAHAEYVNAQELYQKNIADNFMAKTKGMKYYIVEYSDNDGSAQCTLEHGGTFDSIPHIRVSKH